MSNLTYHEAEAQRLGFPAGVCGYDPNETGYWTDPSLGWANQLVSPEVFGLNPDEAAAELARLIALPLVWNENMAPRFPTGTWLAGRRVTVGQPVAVGAVLCFYLPGEVPDCPGWARVVSLQGGELRLACDNGGRAYCLPWTTDAAARVGRVYEGTHYIRLPVL